MSLLFGKPRSSSSQSSSPNFDNQTIQEKVINDRDVNLFEGNDQQVILVGRYSSGTPSNLPSNIGRQVQSPSNFPTPPAGGRPSQPVYVPKYRPAPKIVNPGLGAGANPAGAGGGVEFDDQCPITNKEQSQESSTHHHDFTQKSKIKKKRNQHLN